MIDYIIEDNCGIMWEQDDNNPEEIKKELIKDDCWYSNRGDFRLMIEEIVIDNIFII